MIRKVPWRRCRNGLALQPSFLRDYEGDLFGLATLHYRFLTEIVCLAGDA